MGWKGFRDAHIEPGTFTPPYLGVNRMSDLTALEDRHEETFGTPIFAQFWMESPRHDMHRTAFEMPIKGL